MAIARAAALWSAPLPPVPSAPPSAVRRPASPSVAVRSPASPPPARPAAGPTVARPDDRSLAGLLDLIGRADALPHRRRPGRAVLTRSPGAPRALRPLPVARPVPVPRPRPAAPAPVRPAPAGTVPGRTVPGRTVPVRTVPVPGSRLRARLRATVRRLALWGAGPDGAYAAWPTPPVAVPPPGPGLVRRLALWGAGPDGAHLAWGAPRPTAPAPAGHRPVVLTELPSTPTIASAVPSPTAASSPAPAARPAPPPRDAGPALAPAGWPVRPGGGLPRARAPDPAVAAGGTVRARGDPAAHRARGSPRPPPAPDRPSRAPSRDAARPLPSSTCPTGPVPPHPAGNRTAGPLPEQFPPALAAAP